jgi:PHD/YefM family antitoxin component YafN of YafNO toxin-antitoxin module
MKATIVDLRYKMKDILKALERKEKVAIMYHGKQKGIIIPASETNNKQTQISEHPFFGMLSRDTNVSEVMTQLRGGRYRAV